ncbi:acyl-CoA/acyl-ACP dehydrogenase [Diaminobutyricibacter tongyongensis]|uniref:Acyl-CoA/acyl-ACP dehydrogenase n=1 Tax=Leifsonia tongyongensis TaxID=1268043 RepID=A0A6L9XW48_9MICO|nr:acyl-CoA/acyl-ACP dehydrogenase [Diaminobutyricibacter tongyongensis]NEN05437.1 acyl-CoA/acyl-ACP dehydrogenase [Diaminobutyricibacter tongyongensis]
MDGERGEPYAGLEVTSAGERYLEAAAICDGQVAPLLGVLRDADPAALAPRAGSRPGATAERHRFLARTAAADVTAARVLEPHLDALAILAEAGLPQNEPGHTWGVFAAEARDAVLVATQHDSSWVLDGVKPWCSLGGRLTDALVTARTASGQRRMFHVELTSVTVIAEPATWVSRGLADVESGPLRFERAAAEPIGDSGWYLSRPGFRWGSIDVAAAWWGGCLPLFSALLTRAQPESASPLLCARVGRLFRMLDSTRLALERAAQVVDAKSVESVEGGPVGEDAAAVLAHSVRGTAADAVAETISAAHDLLGPAVFGFDESLARRAADLEMYVSQYHRGPDDVSLVAHLGGSAAWW